MKKFYYFSEKSLNFIEIKHFKDKAIAVFTASVLLLSAIVVSVFYIFSNLSERDKDIQTLKQENEFLKNKFSSLSNKYLNLQSELNNISELSNELRLATNLTPISPEVRQLGVGGSDEINNLYSELGSDIVSAINVAEKVSNRFEFEKNQFTEIVDKLKSNNALFESIPAIVPTEGPVSYTHLRAH